jgi:hypothetical protein
MKRPVSKPKKRTRAIRPKLPQKISARLVESSLLRWLGANNKSPASVLSLYTDLESKIRGAKGIRGLCQFSPHLYSARPNLPPALYDALLGEYHLRMGDFREHKRSQQNNVAIRSYKKAPQRVGAYLAALERLSGKRQQRKP